MENYVEYIKREKTKTCVQISSARPLARPPADSPLPIVSQTGAPLPLPPPPVYFEKQQKQLGCFGTTPLLNECRQEFLLLGGGSPRGRGVCCCRRRQGCGDGMARRGRYRRLRRAGEQDHARGVPAPPAAGGCKLGRGGDGQWNIVGKWVRSAWGNQQ